MTFGLVSLQLSAPTCNRIPRRVADRQRRIPRPLCVQSRSLLHSFCHAYHLVEVPRWAFLLCALGLFVYQTLDACDGKQARRTGTSSPLGELFDHGCDSISTVFVALAVCIAVKLGSYPAWMFFQCFVAITLFYCAHWQTYVSGTLRFGKFDVTEAQFSVIMIHLISAIFGPDIWATKVVFVELPLKFLPLCIGVTAASFALVSYAGTIFTGGVGKNGSTVAGTSVLSPSIPIALVVVPAFIIYQKSTGGIYEHHPCLYIIAFGMVAAKVTNRLVVAHMCRSEMDYMDSALLGPGMLFLNQYFNTFINEYAILLVCLVYSVADLLHYSVIVCNQICAHLQIPLLRIAPRFPAPLVPSSAASTDRAAAAPTAQSQADAEEACTPLLTTEEPPPYHESLVDLDSAAAHA
ncbi:choline/ethanolaminephosphotransferase 1-like isoform X4 [Haemaphysalis longicornis]